MFGYFKAALNTLWGGDAAQAQSDSPLPSQAMGIETPRTDAIVPSSEILKTVRYRRGRHSLGIPVDPRHPAQPVSGSPFQYEDLSGRLQNLSVKDEGINLAPSQNHSHHSPTTPAYNGNGIQKAPAPSNPMISQPVNPIIASQDTKNVTFRSRPRHSAPTPETPGVVSSTRSAPVAPPAFNRLTSTSNRPSNNPGRRPQNPGLTKEELDSKTPFGFVPGVELYDYQIEGRKWMYKMEHGPFKGGILNDMGLGKTIQAITRISDSKLLQGEKGATLIICPMALFSQWQEACANFAPHLRVSQYHGPNRTTEPDDFDKYDVLITNYETVASEHQKLLAYEADSEGGNDDMAGSQITLFRHKFLRTILDEVHEIRNRGTQKSEGCFGLQATYHWGLSGTLVHNGVDDLYALFRLVGVAPYSDWEEFRTAVKMSVLSEIITVLSKFSMRRTKAQHLKLPPKNFFDYGIELDEHERPFYDALKERLTLVLNKFITSGKKYKGNANFRCAFTWLLRLRQCVCNPGLCLCDKTKEDYDDALGARATSEKCALCLNKVKGRSFVCHACKDLVNSNLYARDTDDPDSSKMRALKAILDEIHQSSGGKDKVIVFSQFTGFLDMIAKYLAKHTNYKSTQYDGRLSQKDRVLTLERFNTDAEVTIALVSIKAGGVGLNLNVANHGILMDLLYNPAIEDQAFDRLHRIGQTKPVNIYRIVVIDSVEDGMKQIQDRKRQLAEDVMAGISTAEKHTVKFRHLASVIRNHSLSDVEAK